jgi:cardiolipin synthase
MRMTWRLPRVAWALAVHRLLQCTSVLLLAACAQPVHDATPAPRLRTDDAVGRGILPSSMLVEPRDGPRGVVRLINRAQTSIFVEIYILSDSRIMHALERASAQGVLVYVLLEPHPYGLASQPLGVAERLRAAGIRVRWSRPGFVYTHAKTIVVDDRIAVISTANFSRSAFTHNREFLLIDRRPRDVRAISAIFRADWDRLSTRINDDDLLISPDNSRSKLVRLIESARRHLDIYAEEVADGRMERLLAGVRARGVIVRVLLPIASTPGARWLVAHGVAVRALASPYIHAKAIIVDGREAFVGSENLSSTSLDHNRELGILVRGADVLVLRRVFSRDWSSHG